MIARIAAIALAFCGVAAAAAAAKQLRAPKHAQQRAPKSLAKPGAVRVADIDPTTVNSTAWLVAYQFDDNACATQPISGAMFTTLKCLPADPSFDDYSSFQYVCDHGLGAGLLTYSGFSCEPETFIEFVELAAVSALDQCELASFSDVPDVVDDLSSYVDGQIWQCTDNDIIGYDLYNQPAIAQYDKDCKKGLRAIGYYRTEDCLTTNDFFESSFSVTCSKKKGFKATEYDDATCTEVNYVNEEDVDFCMDWYAFAAGDEPWDVWTEKMACDGSKLGDAAVSTSAGHLWMLAPLLLLLGMAIQM